MSDINYQNGFGCVWGIGTAAISVGFGVLIPLDEELAASRTSEAAYDVSNGSVVSETFYRKEAVLRIRVYPGGTSLTIARDANAYIWEPGQEIVLVDLTDPAINEWWVLLELGKTRRFDSKAYWDLVLRRHGNNLVRGTNQRLSATVFS